MRSCYAHLTDSTESTVQPNRPSRYSAPLYGDTAVCQASASALEPALGNLLRLFGAWRINDITDRATFCELDPTEEGLRVSARDFGIDVRRRPRRTRTYT